MGYTAEIINEFRGTINEVEFDDKQLFWSVAFVLDQLDEQGLRYNNLIIDQLRMGIDYLLRKDYLSLNDIEAEMVAVIEEERCFPYDFVTNSFEDANEELRKLNPLTLDDVLHKYDMTMEGFAYELLVEHIDVAPLIVLSEEWGMSNAEVDLVMNGFGDIIVML